jgi:hypothetical protein
VMDDPFHAWREGAFGFTPLSRLRLLASAADPPANVRCGSTVERRIAPTAWSDSPAVRFRELHLVSVDRRSLGQTPRPNAIGRMMNEGSGVGPSHAATRSIDGPQSAGFPGAVMGALQVAPPPRCHALAVDPQPADAGSPRDRQFTSLIVTVGRGPSVRMALRLQRVREDR